MSIRTSMNLCHSRYVTHAPTICVCPRRVSRLRDSTSSTSLYHHLHHISCLGPRTSLYTTSGAVTADVSVTGNNRSKQVSMKLCSDNGPVCTKIVSYFLPIYSAMGCPKIHQNAHSMTSFITVRAVNPALPSTLSFGQTLETSHSRYPAISAGQLRSTPLTNASRSHPRSSNARRRSRTSKGSVCSLSGIDPALGGGTVTWIGKEGRTRANLRKNLWTSYLWAGVIRACGSTGMANRSFLG